MTRTFKPSGKLHCASRVNVDSVSKDQSSFIFRIILHYISSWTNWTWWCRRYNLMKHQEPFTPLTQWHSITFYKTHLLCNTTMRNSNLAQVMDAAIHILSNSLFINYPTIWQYTIGGILCVVEYTRKMHRVWAIPLSLNLGDCLKISQAISTDLMYHPTTFSVML